MFSQYLRARERDGIVALFHELHPDPVFMTLAEWERIRSGVIDFNDPIRQELFERKLLIASTAEDQQEFAATEARLIKKLNQPVILYLMTAQGCNFRCSYCPVPEIARTYGESLLSREDAFAGIDLWQEHLNSVYDAAVEYYVIFYGGEPLLNKPVIKDSLEYLRAKQYSRQLPQNLNYMIATNGSLIDDEMLTLFSSYNMLVSVGIDGLRLHNDAMKFDVHGNGTFNRVVEAIGSLRARNIRTLASVSITPYNIDFVQEIGEFLRGIGVERFGFNFLKGQMLVDLVGKDGLEAYYRRASNAVIEHWRRHGGADFEYQMFKKQHAFEMRDFFPVDCTCYGNQLVIQPDGNISNCPFTKTMLGHVSTTGPGFRIWEQETVLAWRRRLPLYHNSDAKALCGGGCAWGTSEIKGSMQETDDCMRIFSEEALDVLIWKRFDEFR